MLAIDVFQSGGFATQTAQIIKFRTPHFRRPDQINFIHHSRTLGEYALHALTKADLAHREAGLWPTTARDDDAFKRLQAVFVAFFDLYLYANRVARSGLLTAGGWRWVLLLPVWRAEGVRPPELLSPELPPRLRIR